MKQLQDNFTTIEQSKRLLELGVPADSANCYWQFRSDTLAEDWGYRCYIGTSPAIKDNLYSFRNGYTIPCWSVGRLIEIYGFGTNQHIGNIWYRNPMECIISDIEISIENGEMDFSKLE